MDLLIKLLESPWFWLDVILSIWGGIVVWRGLSIETKAEKLLPPDNFKPDIFEDVIAKYKSEIKRGGRIVMRGVFIEVIAALGISIISGLQSADLNDKAEQAERDAAHANERSSKNEVRSFKLKSENLLLQSNVLALELEAQWRTISPTQETNLIGAFNVQEVRRRSTNAIIIRSEISDVEAVWFARRLVNVLTKCGFNAQDEEELGFSATNSPGPFIGLGFLVNRFLSSSNPAACLTMGDKIATLPVNGTPQFVFRFNQENLLIIPTNGNAGIVVFALVKNGVVPTVIQASTNITDGDIAIVVGHKP